MSEPLRNWAGNVVFGHERFHRPGTLVELQRLVAGSSRLRVLGSGHSFNRIADTTGDLVSVADLPERLELDAERRTVTVAAGTRYGRVGAFLAERGWALHNTGSLPHISVAGACATGTHGSGDTNQALAGAVRGLELVTATGDLVTLDPAGEGFAGSVVALGALGVVTAVTLEIRPSYDVRQLVYDDLPFHAVLADFDRVMAAGYSVSLFTSWRRDVFEMAWLKQLVPAEPGIGDDPQWLGGRLADTPRHPLAGMPAENATEQLGVPGPWNQRLPHFRIEFTPSVGEELQSEYLLPREHAVAALTALDAVKSTFAPLVQVGEIRTVAADDLWLSPAYGRDVVAVHFTWLPAGPAVDAVLPVVEEALAPFDARPHWGKVFRTAPDVVRGLYPRSADFAALATGYDPAGTFRNEMLDRYLFG